MPDYAGEPVPIRVIDPEDDNGDPLNDTNSSATVEIFPEDDTTTPVLVETAVPWVSTQFRYVWDTTGRTAGRYLAKVTVTPDAALPLVEWHLIVLAALPGQVSACRGPWLNPTDLPALDGLEEADRELVVAAASEMMFNATCQKFIGVCTDVVRPPSANCVGGFLPGTRLGDGSLWLGDDGLSTLPESTFGPLGMVDGTVVASPVMAHSTIRLPGVPIITVVRVTVDGTDLPDGSWLIVDDRDLVRADGKSWPLWQRLDRAAGQPGTWTIEYTWGIPVPSSGVLAARVLSAELGLSLNQDAACRLPKRLQSITREGLSAVILDPFQFLDKGGFGIYEIDTFINSWNPYHISREAKVLNPDLIAAQPRRIR